jgi:hypothetical protein
VSLDVQPDLLERASRGDINEADFVACVRASLPYAWQTIGGLVSELRSVGGERPFVDNQVPPPSEEARGQLLRALASDAIRGALERHFGVALAFQNCHRVAVFRPEDTAGDTYRVFVSPRAQLLNQSPELRDC